MDALDTTGSINARKAVEGLLKREPAQFYIITFFLIMEGQVEIYDIQLVKRSEYRTTIEEAMGELVFCWLINNNDLTTTNGISIDAGESYI